MATKFYLFPRQDKKGDHPIRVSLSIRGTRLISTVGYSIGSDSWNPLSQSVKKGHYNAAGVAGNVINARIKAIDAHFSQLDISIDHRPSKDELAEQLAIVKGKPRKRSKQEESGASNVMEAFDAFVLSESRECQWTEGTLQCWRAFRGHLENQHINDFDEIDEEMLARFVNYLRTQKKMADNTVEKHYSNMHWFLAWCERKGLCKNDSYRRYRPKFKVIAPPVIFLTKEELLRVYNYRVPANGTAVILSDYDGNDYEKVISDASALEKTRDLFCFCCFTGLRYSDMANLRRVDISDGIISVVTKKTNDALKIELNNYSSAILEKYKDAHFPGDRALPVISNQRMNDYVKILGELCGINTPIPRSAFVAGKKIEYTKPKFEMLGTHAGRRTFICFALSSGIPPQVVMKWTGHSDYKAMKPYIDIAESTKAEAMKKFNLIEE